jgi:plasmid maintenance system antidote protein VapI
MPPTNRKHSEKVQQFIGDILTAMDEQDVSRADLAELLECSPAYVSKLLKGGENLTMGTMERLAEVLGLDLAVSVRSQAAPEAEDPGESPPAEEAPAEPGHDPFEALLTRYVEVRSIEDAQALLATGGRELRTDVVRLFRTATDQHAEPKGKPGPKPGSAEDYRPQMLYIALLLESCEVKSEREACRRAESWANTHDFNRANWETLRIHFRRSREFYRAQARAILAQQPERKPRTKGDAVTGDAGAGRPAARAVGGGSASGVGGLPSTSGSSVPLSSLAWVNEELGRIGQRHGLDEASVAFLQSPGVFERIGYLAEIQETAAAIRPLMPELSATAGIARDAQRIAAQMAVPTVPDEVGAMARALNAPDMRAQLSPDVTRRIKTLSQQMDEVFRGLKGSPMWDLYRR